MEFHMSEPTTSTEETVPPMTEDEAIRQRVKGLTSQVLQQGRVDPEAVREVASAVLGRTPGSTVGDRCEGPRILRRSSEAA